MTYEPKLPDETVNYSAGHPLREFFKIGSALSGVIVALYFVLGWSVDLLASHISPTFEQKILRAVKTELPGLKSVPELEALAETLQVCASLPYDPQVSLSASREVNAYALPGGGIVLNRGLVDAMESENELAFILAHEMGHLKHRDHLRGMGRALVGLSIGALLGLSEAPDILNSGLRFGESRFSQEQETAADLFALEVLQCRYGHIAGATDFFERHKEKDPAKWFLFASHPELEARIKRLQHEVAKRGYTEQDLRPALTYEDFTL